MLDILNAHSPFLQFLPAFYSPGCSKLTISPLCSHLFCLSLPQPKKPTYTTIQFMEGVQKKKLASITSHDSGLLYNLIMSWWKHFRNKDISCHMSHFHRDSAAWYHFSTAQPVSVRYIYSCKQIFCHLFLSVALSPSHLMLFLFQWLKFYPAAS